ncbi:MAG: LysM peptidoglycan-binding domain-containing protein [Solirubrobacteraceae bacterium]
MLAKSVRFLAPIALVAVALGVYLVVHSNLPRQHAGAAAQSTTTSRLVNGHRRTRHRARTPRIYVVKSGDTLSGISAKTGIGLSRLIQLNPWLGKSQNSLQIGKRLRLRN